MRCPQKTASELLISQHSLSLRGNIQWLSKGLHTCTRTFNTRTTCPIYWHFSSPAVIRTRNLCAHNLLWKLLVHRSHVLTTTAYERTAHITTLPLAQRHYTVVVEKFTQVYTNVNTWKTRPINSHFSSPAGTRTRNLYAHNPLGIPIDHRSRALTTSVSEHNGHIATCFDKKFSVRRTSIYFWLSVCVYRNMLDAVWREFREISYGLDFHMGFSYFLSGFQSHSDFTSDNDDDCANNSIGLQVTKVFEDCTGTKTSNAKISFLKTGEYILRL